MWVIKPKEEGGLGIQVTRAKNIALLAKLNWRLYQERESLWAKILLSEYCSQHWRNSEDPDKLPCSYNWAAVKVGFPVFEKGIYWNVGNNTNLKFWGSNWVKGSAVREFIEGPLNQHENNLAIAKKFQNGKWDWRKISFDLPRVVTDKIQAIPMQLFGEKDSLTWKFSYDGTSALPRPTMGNWIWKFDTLPKIKHFIWLCFHNSVPVRQVINARGINIYYVCIYVCRFYLFTCL